MNLIQKISFSKNIYSQDSNDGNNGGGKTETSNATKLRNFLNFSLSLEDRLPKGVCVQCVTNLDYCIQ